MKTNYVIIGTGFASAAAVSVLVEKKIKPTIVDIGEDNFDLTQDDKNKLPLGVKDNNSFSSLTNFSINESELLSSSSFGGLSRIWGGAINKPHKNEFKKWPINKNKLEKYYQHIDKFFLHEGCEDSYSVEFNLKKPDKTIKNNLNPETFLKNYKSIFIGNARRAIQKNNKVLILNNFFRDLIKKKKINLISNFKVEKISESKNNIKIISKNKIINCKKLFIASGALATSQIILNSFKNLKHIYLNETSLVSSLWFGFRQINKYKSNINCDYYLTKTSGNIFSSQIYILKNITSDKIFSRNFVIKFIFKLIPEFIKSKFFIALTYLDQKASNKVSIVKINNKFSIKNFKKNKSTYEMVEKDISKFFKNKVFQIIKIKKRFGYGYHFGASFPMSNKKKTNKSDRLGRIFNMKNIHIIDGSVLPIIPVSTITYTIMANASRIVDESTKKKY